MELKGILYKIHPTVTNGNFSSRKVWIKTDLETQYPQIVELEVSQTKLNLFNTIPIGAGVNISFNLKGREWTNKEDKTMVFNTLSVWKVEVVVEAEVKPMRLSDTAIAAGAVQDDDRKTEEIKTFRRDVITALAAKDDDINNPSDDLPF